MRGIGGRPSLELPFSPPPLTLLFPSIWHTMTSDNDSPQRQFKPNPNPNSKLNHKNQTPINTSVQSTKPTQKGKLIDSIEREFMPASLSIDETKRHVVCETLAISKDIWGIWLQELFGEKELLADFCCFD